MALIVQRFLGPGYNSCKTRKEAFKWPKALSPELETSSYIYLLLYYESYAPRKPLFERYNIFTLLRERDADLKPEIPEVYNFQRRYCMCQFHVYATENTL